MELVQEVQAHRECGDGPQDSRVSKEWCAAGDAIRSGRVVGGRRQGGSRSSKRNVGRRETQTNVRTGKQECAKRTKGVEVEELGILASTGSETDVRVAEEEQEAESGTRRRKRRHPVSKDEWNTGMMHFFEAGADTLSKAEEEKKTVAGQVPMNERLQ